MKVIINETNEDLNFLIKNTIPTFSLVFGGKITAYGGGNDDTLNTVKAGAGTIYIQDGTGINLLNRLWVIGDTDESGQDQTQTFISGETADDFHYDIISLKGTLLLRLPFTGV